MKNLTLIVNDGNCGECPAEYKTWLEENLPEHITLDWRDRVCGVGDGLFRNDNSEINKNEHDYIDFWEKFCNG